VGARDARVSKLLGVGLVPRLFDVGFLIENRKPIALVHGSDDELATPDEVTAVWDRMSEPKHLSLVDGARHLFPGKLDALENAVDAAIAFLLSR
jgi:alpha-beta hydrolase superfamily lysophospholipase